MQIRLWSRIRLFLVTVVVAVVALSPLASVLAEQNLRSHGVNPVDMDLSVDPDVDFYRYANGGWLDRTTIPADYASIETLSELDARTREQLIDLLQHRAASGDVQSGSDEWKAIRLFEQGTDIATRNAQGIEPIRPILDEIDAIDDLAELHRFLQTSIFQNVDGLFTVVALPDMVNSAQTAAYLRPAALGLPSYWQDATTQGLHDAYVANSAKLLTLVGRDAVDVQTAARAVYDFEARLWAPLLSLEEAQDLSVVYNPTSLEELTASYPLMDWPAYLADLGLRDVSGLVVVEPRYMSSLDRIVRDTPLPVLRDFLTLQLIRTSSGILSEAMEATAFEFYGATLNGMEAQEPIELRTLTRVNRYLGDALGKLYVEAYFPPEAKARSAELTRELIDAFRGRLENNPWMTDVTRARALEKLDALNVKVGYPDRWREYDVIAITDSYYGTVTSAWNASYRYGLSQIGDPVDASAWPFPPQTVNAMYDTLNHEIIIPAAMLQPPLFNAQADPASNFGAIGFIIGHEITHGFDPQGAQFDAQGNLSDWWTPADYERFQALNDEVVAQYSGIEILPGRTIDGQLTVTENVADMGGIQVAYDALQKHLETHGRPAVDGAELTQEQIFFVAAATVWRAETRAEALATQLSSDPHAPSSARATQPLRNCDAFYAAFDIAPGDPMYLPPEERIVIW